jgi:ribosome modulation factor
MNLADIRNSLRILHEKEGRDAAILGQDRGLCPYLVEPDMSDWLRGFDSLRVPPCAYDSSYEYSKDSDYWPGD